MGCGKEGRVQANVKLILSSSERVIVKYSLSSILYQYENELFFITIYIITK